MSYEDLQRLGLLKREEGGNPYLKGPGPFRLPFLVAALSSVAGCVLMYAGGGRLLTWVGVVVFFFSLFLFTFTSIRFVESVSRSDCGPDGA